ncbi:MAG: hypothetical protein ABIN25_10360 [Ginsengibacter sp.]
MKTPIFSIVSLLLICSSIGCANKSHRYVDLETGNYVDLVKDPTNGHMVNADTKEPVVIYVDTDTKDTIYGKTGKIINGNVVKSDDGKYKYVSNENTGNANPEDGAYKIKDGDYKKKVEKDGDIKIKDGDTKIKIDGETGEKKVKSD